MHPWDAIWIFFILSSLQPLIQKQLLAASRRRMLLLIATRRKATVITLIHRALGPVDPQLGQYAARSLVEVAAMPGQHQDQNLLLADVGRKALRQVEAIATELLERHMESQRARDLAHLLASGVWTHDHPLMARELQQLGLPVTVGVPAEERKLMDLYPQPRGRETGVEYAPERPLPPGIPPSRDHPRRRREAPAMKR